MRLVLANMRDSAHKFYDKAYASYIDGKEQDDDSAKKPRPKPKGKPKPKKPKKDEEDPDDEEDPEGAGKIDGETSESGRSE